MGFWSSLSGLRRFFSLTLFRGMAPIRASLQIFCLSRMAEMFLCMGQTKRLVLAPLHLVLLCCFLNWTVLRHHKSTGTRVKFYCCCPLGLWNVVWSTGTLSCMISIFIYICLRCLVCTHFSSCLPFTRCQSSVNLWGSFYG